MRITGVGDDEVYVRRWACTVLDGVWVAFDGCIGCVSSRWLRDLLVYPGRFLHE